MSRFQSDKTKKCPECFERLTMDAKVCQFCKTKVGPPNKHGIAQRPFDWLGYGTAVIAVSAFAGFLYWLFVLKDAG